MDQRPLRVRQIRRVAKAATICGDAMLRLPHRQTPCESSSPQGSHNRLFRLDFFQDRLSALGDAERGQGQLKNPRRRVSPVGHAPPPRSGASSRPKPESSRNVEEAPQLLKVQLSLGLERKLDEACFAGCLVNIRQCVS